MTAILLSSDLFFSSRVTGAGTAAGVPVATAGSGEQVVEKITQAAAGDAPVKLVVLDLTSPACDVAAIVPAVRGAAEGIDIVAFGPHVQTARLEAAQAAGCDAVLTRGQFDRELPALLARYA